jgi:hypothetical protein
VLSPVEPSGMVRRVTDMRSLDTIDRELEFIAGVRSAIRRLGGRPSTQLVDELLDERLARRASSRTPQPTDPPDAASRDEVLDEYR